MRTTELFVEQVLIGLLVMLVGGLMFSDRLLAVLLDQRFDQTMKLLSGLGIAGAAYLIGIVYDRCADTLVEDIDQHSRLHFALKGQKEVPRTDPFPEHVYRMQILERGGAVSNYADYLRTRIRLSRALATLLPALCVGYVLMPTKSKETDGVWMVGAIATGLVYALALIYQAAVRGRKWEAKWIGERWRGKRIGYKPPKTSELDQLGEYMRKRGILDGSKPGEKRGLGWFAAQEPAFWGALALGAVACAPAFVRGDYGLLIVPPVGLGLTLLVGWSWWRISVTFLRLLAQYRDLGQAK